MKDRYREGRLDGLREAIAIMGGLEDGVADKLSKPSPIRTRNARRTRWQAYRVARTRLTTALRRREGNRDGLLAALERAGL